MNETADLTLKSLFVSCCKIEQVENNDVFSGLSVRTDGTVTINNFELNSRLILLDRLQYLLNRSPVLARLELDSFRSRPVGSGSKQDSVNRFDWSALKSLTCRPIGSYKKPSMGNDDLLLSELAHSTVQLDRLEIDERNLQPLADALRHSPVTPRVLVLRVYHRVNLERPQMDAMLKSTAHQPLAKLETVLLRFPNGGGTSDHEAARNLLRRTRAYLPWPGTCAVHMTGNDHIQELRKLSSPQLERLGLRDQSPTSTPRASQTAGQVLTLEMLLRDDSLGYAVDPVREQAGADGPDGEERDQAEQKPALDATIVRHNVIISRQV